MTKSRAAFACKAGAAFLIWEKIIHNLTKTFGLAAAILTLAIAPALAQTDSSGGTAAADEQAAKQELVQQVANPLASLISVPIQNNWDFGIGPADAM